MTSERRSPTPGTAFDALRIRTLAFVVAGLASGGWVTATLEMDDEPQAVAVNPVTGRVYAANGVSNDVSVISDLVECDSRVRVELDPSIQDTTGLGRPWLGGKGVNRMGPEATALLGVLNRANAAPADWYWDELGSGQGTDSVRWLWSWARIRTDPAEARVGPPYWTELAEARFGGQSWTGLQLDSSRHVTILAL